MPCPTEEELNAQVYYPQKIYPHQVPQQVMNQAGDCYRLIPCPPPQSQPVYQNCRLVKVRVLKACGGQWSLMQEMTLNSPPGVGTSIIVDGGAYKIESLLLLGSDDGYDSYEALVIPALQGSYEVGPWTSRGNDCGCQSPPVIHRSCGCQTDCGCNTGCGYPGPSTPMWYRHNYGNPCVNVPYPVYALKGYPW